MSKIILAPNSEPPYNTKVIYPAYNDKLRDPDQSDADFLQQVIARNITVGVLTNDYRIIDEEDLPDEKTLDLPYSKTHTATA